MTSSFSRRSFLRHSALAATAPLILPSSTRAAPSERIVMGFIGVGGMGSGNLNSFLNHKDVQVVAVCDVDRGRARSAADNVNKRYGTQDCATYSDFRELIARTDLDAVALALPDHWHTIPAVMAAQAGLDIYGEKPLARSIVEGRHIVNAVQRNGRVWQTGSWQRSQENFRRGAELVRNGRIGKIQKVEVGLPTGGGTGDHAPQPVPEGVDWDMWLGPAPWAEYTNQRMHYQWRWIQDYSGGQLTDWAGHHIDIAHWGLGCDHTGPRFIQGTATFPKSGLWNTATHYRIQCEYETGVVFEIADASQIPMGTKWIGDEGWVRVDRGGVLQASDPAILREQIGAGETRLYRSTDHQRNFLDCVKSRQLTITPVETAHRSISVGLLCEIAFLTGRKIKWDPVTETIANDPGASALLHRAYRAPWTLA